MRIALCRPVYDTIEYDAAESVIEFMDARASLTSDEWSRASARGQPVDHVRNTIVEQALGELRAEVLVWQDSDIGIPDARDYVQIVHSLVTSPSSVGIVAAPVLQQGSRGAPTVNFSMGTLAHAPNTKAPFEVAGCGFGFVAVRAEVYEGMSRPWHRFEYGADGRLASGEDIGFCDRARALGWSILVDPTIEARHNFRRSHSLRGVDQELWNKFAE